MAPHHVSFYGSCVTTSGSHVTSSTLTAHTHTHMYTHTHAHTHTHTHTQCVHLSHVQPDLHDQKQGGICAVLQTSRALADNQLECLVLHPANNHFISHSVYCKLLSLCVRVCVYVCACTCTCVYVCSLFMAVHFSLRTSLSWFLCCHCPLPLRDTQLCYCIVTVLYVLFACLW